MTDDAEDEGRDDAAVGPSATGAAPPAGEDATGDSETATAADKDTVPADATPEESQTGDATPEGSQTGDATSEGAQTDDATSEGAQTDDATSEDPQTGDATPEASADPASSADDADESDVPRDVREYTRFSKVDGAQYERVNEFLRERTYITAREWAIARLCADFRTETGVEMTKIGENLPELVPFMTDTYSPQAVNQARSAFEEKVRMAGATFLYGAMSDFFTADELDDLMYEVTEVAKFLLEVEGVDLAVEEELESEEQISSVMREVRQASTDLRHDETECPHCGHEIGADADD